MIFLGLVVVGIVFIAQGLFSFLALPGASNFILLLLGIGLFALGLILWMIKNFYVKPSANIAYVITGLGGRRVLIDRGAFYFPVVQQLVPVSLETMKLDVERTGADALITKDNLRVDVKGEFYIKVLPDQEDVLNAARSLGEKSVNSQSVAKLVFEKLVSALRSVAATKDLVEIHSQRDAFASAVSQLVLADLEQNGLTLESVTVSRFDQTSQDLLSDANIFDAQGKRKITEITQSALVERNRLEQEALREITIKNVETRRETLALERQQAEAEAEQQALIAKARAERNREAETYRIEQERQVREGEIAQDQAVKTRAAERDRELVMRDRELKQAEIERQKAVELAQRQKEIAMAEAEKLRAEAEKAFLEAQAKREEANQSIVTVQRLAEAEREAQTKLIAAKQQIEQERVRQQTTAEVQAYTELKNAEAKKQAAVLDADAILTRAEAEAQSREKLARADTVLKRVDVDIEREKVDVESARVEVEKQALENRQTYSAAALEFELEKLKIEAQKFVQAEMAKAIGEFMSRGNMQIFGSPETMATMMQQYTKGMGVGQMLDGVLEGAESLTNGKLKDVASQVQAVIQGKAQSDAKPKSDAKTITPTAADD
jgi:flotillin